ncbi:MAG TPA: hypothetical protein VEO00_04610 [Actinomycetota bacterium]|nr:hypothetical protein [Actinomycetota bacterium]
MESAQLQTTMAEDQVRAAILAALTPFDAVAEQNQPGMLVLETGSVGKAYLAGGFRAEAKMPMRITVATAGGTAGTGVSIQVASRGGGGLMSGGILGMRKARRAEKTWLDRTVAAVQPAGGMGPQQPPPPPPGPPPATPSV